MKRTTPVKSVPAKKPAVKKKPAAAPKRPRTSASSRATPSSPSRPKPSARLAKVAEPTVSAAASPSTAPATKQSQLIALLRSSAGGTMQQMVTLTGWVPDTVRGMISGSLRKRLGLNVQHQRIDGVRVYRIVKAAAQ